MARTDDPTPPGPRDDELAERGRALVAEAVAATRAPEPLRARIEAERRKGRPERHRRQWLGLAGSLAAAAAVAAIAITVAGDPAPTVTAASALGDRTPTLPAPPRDPANRAVLRATVDGTPFPDWRDDFPWRPLAARRDTLQDRPATTVWYRNPQDVRLAYTIVGGASLDLPEGARTVMVRGKTFHVVRMGDENVVVWKRRGNTCVMSAPAGVPQDRLLALAAWDAGGDVPF